MRLPCGSRMRRAGPGRSGGNPGGVSRLSAVSGRAACQRPGMYTQLTFHSQGRFAWQPAGGDIGAFVRTFARIVGPRLVAFGLADQHGHAIVEAPDAVALGHIRTNLLRAKPMRWRSPRTRRRPTSRSRGAARTAR